MKTIVALVDFSNDTFKVLKQVHQFAGAFGSRVILLHVVPPQPVVMDLGIASPTVLETPSPETLESERDVPRFLRELLAQTVGNAVCERLGYTPGKPDGKVHPATLAAIRHFEKDNNLPVTGEASVSVLRQLKAATLSAN